LIDIILHTNQKFATDNYERNALFHYRNFHCSLLTHTNLAECLTSTLRMNERHPFSILAYPTIGHKVVLIKTGFSFSEMMPASCTFNYYFLFHCSWCADSDSCSKTI